MARRRLLTSGELADELGLSRRAISDYARQGKITPALRTPGGQYRWNLEQVKAEMDALWKQQRGE